MNLGEGELLISHNNGWACSREALFDVEYDMQPDNTSAKRTSIITCKGLFSLGEEIKNGEMVTGVFKYENGAKIAFTANVQGKARFVLIGPINNDFETILNKISQWQEYFKEN